MYLVTKRIDFCYGHRLLDYDGNCKFPHGHNAVVEIDVQAAALDHRNMVVDFSDIKKVVKAWIDRELDHKMILRHDDPLTAVLRGMGEPVLTLD
nr:6-carboxytetrahydropterin synthase [Acidobacteriota bacterium]